jgi:hypothetical protein
VNQNQRHPIGLAASLQGKIHQEFSMYGPPPELQHPAPQHVPPPLIAASSPTIDALSIQQPMKRGRNSVPQGGDGRPWGRPRKAAKGEAGQPILRQESCESTAPMPQMAGYGQTLQGGHGEDNWESFRGYAPRTMQHDGGNVVSDKRQRQDYGYEQPTRRTQELGFGSPYSDIDQDKSLISQLSFLTPQPYQQRIADRNGYFKFQQTFYGTRSPYPSAIQPLPHNRNGTYDPATQQDGTVGRISYGTASPLDILRQQNLQYNRPDTGDVGFSLLDDEISRSISPGHPPRTASRTSTTAVPAILSNVLPTQVVPTFSSALISTSSESAGKNTPVTAELLRNLPPAKAQQIQQRIDDIKNGVKWNPNWARSGTNSMDGQREIPETLEGIETAQRQN